jgi:hypothetical protein
MDGSEIIETESVQCLPVDSLGIASINLRAEAERLHLSSIPCGSGMENGKTWPRPIPRGWRMGRHGRDQSYRICWRSWRVAIREGTSAVQTAQIHLSGKQGQPQAGDEN